MARIKLGDIFEIETAKGKAYLHYICKDKELGELVRVLEGLYNERPASFDELAGTPEAFMVFFPLSAANRRKIVEKVGNFSSDKYSKPKLMRTEHYVGREFQGWHIIDTNTWERKLIKKLSSNEKKLSPWGCWNDTLLIKNLEKGWNLEEWS